MSAQHEISADNEGPRIELDAEEAKVLAAQVRTYIARLHGRYTNLLTYGQLLRAQFPDEEERPRAVWYTLQDIGTMSDRLRRNASLTYRDALALSLPIYSQT